MCHLYIYPPHYCMFIALVFLAHIYVDLIVSATNVLVVFLSTINKHFLLLLTISHIARHQCSAWRMGRVLRLADETRKKPNSEKVKLCKYIALDSTWIQMYVQMYEIFSLVSFYNQNNCFDIVRNLIKC